MKTEFLKQFEKDLDKLLLQSIKSDVADAIENAENATNTECTFNIVQFRLRLIVLFSCSIGITIVTYFLG